MNVQRHRYEFGRHETFAVREGWLGKGLSRLAETASFRPDLDTADALGLGSRMVKSLQYWLEASGLVQRQEGKGKARDALPTPLASQVLDDDPDLEYPATWWFVHVLVARRPGSVWNWFFNDFPERSFDRTACVEAFGRHVREHASNQTTSAVIHRDIACLLNAYAAPSADQRPDPEDGTVSPLRSLGLVVRHGETGRYERTRPLDRVPIEAFLCAASLVAQDAGGEQVSLPDLLARRDAPGRLMWLDGDSVDAAASAAEAAYRHEGVSVSLLGATRTMSVPPLPPERWLAMHFERIRRGR